MTKDKLISIIEKNMREVKAAHDAYTNASWESKLRNLPAGAITPKKGEFYDEENKQAYNEKVRSLRHAAEAAVEEYASDISLKVSEAPSDAALRAVQMFALLDPTSTTQNDYAQRINDMMNRYGSSSITYETLRGMAVKAGIYNFKPHEEIRARQALEDIPRNVDSFFNVATALTNNSGNVTDGKIDFTIAGIKNLLDVIE